MPQKSALFSIYASLFFTVAMLVTAAHFIMGGLPLLTLDHDTPLDGRFIRRFFRNLLRTGFRHRSGRNDPKAIRSFRATHSLALLVNLAQLIVLV